MHPAYSVIFFTTASGAGYGLLFWLSLLTLFRHIPQNSWVALGALSLALVLITAGLLSSTFHLGHPERAHRAMSQWRSSWLSREGVAAIATYIPAGLLWLSWAFDLPFAQNILAFAAAVLSVITVWCTGMIYASLKTIRQWYRLDVPHIYLSLAGMSGGILLLFVGFVSDMPMPAWMFGCALALILLSLFLKMRYWQSIDADHGAYTVEMATGLGNLGQVRPLDPPHSRPNFVMREMGFAVGRKHAAQLRRYVILALFVLPTLLLVMMLILAPAFFALVALLSMSIGLVLERWLFFAQAEHVSQLYYGKARA